MIEQTTQHRNTHDRTDNTALCKDWKPSIKGFCELTKDKDKDKDKDTFIGPQEFVVHMTI